MSAFATVAGKTVSQETLHALATEINMHLYNLAKRNDNTEKFNKSEG